jgi:hypothetical protein
MADHCSHLRTAVKMVVEVAVADVRRRRCHARQSTTRVGRLRPHVLAPAGDRRGSGPGELGVRPLDERFEVPVGAGRAHDAATREGTPPPESRQYILER